MCQLFSWHIFLGGIFIKRIICVVLCVLVFGSLVAFPVFAAVPFGDAEYDHKDTILNSFGDSETFFTIAPNQFYYFSLYEFYQNGRFQNFIGSYWNESSPFQTMSVSGRVRPFGNTDVDYGSSVGDTINTGYYMPFEAIGNTTSLNFEFGFYLNDVDKTNSILGPETPLDGYFYLFYIDKDSKIIKKVGRPVKFEWEYFSQTYNLSFTANVTIDFGEESPVGSIGFVPVFTFRQLPTDSFATKVFFPHFSFTSYYSYQQKILNDLNQMLNGSNNPSNYDPNNFFKNVETIQKDMSDVAMENFDFGVQSFDNGVDILTQLDSPLLVSKTIMQSFIENVPFISKLLILSVSLSALAVILNITATVSSSNKRK